MLICNEKDKTKRAEMEERERGGDVRREQGTGVTDEPIWRINQTDSESDEGTMMDRQKLREGSRRISRRTLSNTTRLLESH